MTAWADESETAGVSPGGGARATGAAVVAWLASRFAAERDRWMVWSAPLLGLGIGLYFALPVEPAPAWLMAGPVAGGVVLAGRRRAAAWAPSALAGFLVVLGFNVAQLRTEMVRAPVLTAPVGPVKVVGRLLEVTGNPGSTRRLLLADAKIAGVSRAETPVRLRITQRGAGPDLTPGDRVSVLARLMPPAAPAEPGAYDFARRAWFQRLGGVGYALGAPQIVSPAAAGADDFGTRLAALRRALAARVSAAPDARVGAVAAALMTGHRAAIPEAVVEDLRRAGLAHLLAISGLHIGLVAGVVFFAVRALLALVPALALRYPIKKWAALAAIMAAFAYLLISGATIPTRRAFIMTAIVLLAVIFDRGVISMRPVALAALAILLIAPESLLSISFQLSFAAVIALVAGYEAVRSRAHAARGRGRRGRRRWLARIGLYFAMVVLSTVIAELAIAPFAAYHFNRIVSFGLVANLIAIPVMGFWIMPAIVAAFALMPLGLEGLALTPMYAGIDVVLKVAHEVASWPGSTIHVPALPTATLIAIAVGGLWLCLWRRPWRFAGLAVIGGGLAFGLMAPRPDLLVDGTGKLFAVRAPDGKLWLSSARFARRAGRTWLRRDGRDEDQRPPIVADGIDAGDAYPWLSCDSLGCLYRPGLQVPDRGGTAQARAGGSLVAIVRDARALIDDCRRADVVVALVPVRRTCPSAGRVIDRFDLWRGGAQALWFDGDKLRITSVAASRGRRPWVGKPR